MKKKYTEPTMKVVKIHSSYRLQSGSPDHNNQVSSGHQFSRGGFTDGDYE